MCVPDDDDVAPAPGLPRRLQAGRDLADAIVELTRRGAVVRVERDGVELQAPTIELDLDAWLTTWTLLQAWRRLDSDPGEPRRARRAPAAGP